MEKGNKRLLVIIALLLLVIVSYSTYAIYKSTATGTAEVKAAAWVVKVNKADIVNSTTHKFTFGPDDIVWNNSKSGAKDGTIAPGSTGTITILVDASGSEVPVDYTVELGSITADDSAVGEDVEFTVAAAEGSSLSDKIDQSASMTKTVKLQVTWTGATTDSDTKNDADMALAAATISIPVTVKVSQHLN